MPIKYKILKRRGVKPIGRDIIASKIGFIFNFVFDKNHARNIPIKNKITVVKKANLKDKIKGVKSISFIIFHTQIL